MAGGFDASVSLPVTSLESPASVEDARAGIGLPSPVTNR
jgi:hypothetical protein